jgi:predicted nucleic acid-binding protein
MIGRPRAALPRPRRALALSSRVGTFTFLGSNANRDVTLAWKGPVYAPGGVTILNCLLRDFEQAWEYFRRADLHKLSAVDATSFAIMKRARIRIAYIAVGFRLVT